MLTAASTGVIVSIVLATVLGLLWLFSLFLLVVDRISAGAKIVWFLALTLLAPVAIPVYLFLRWRRPAEGAA